MASNESRETMIAQVKEGQVIPTKILTYQELCEWLYSRVEEFVDKTAKRVTEASVPMFPIWSGYEHNFGEAVEATASIDGDTYHHWYTLLLGERGWFDSPHDGFHLIVRTDSGEVEYYHQS